VQQQATGRPTGLPSGRGVVHPEYGAANGLVEIRVGERAI